MQSGRFGRERATLEDRSPHPGGSDGRGPPSRTASTPCCSTTGGATPRGSRCAAPGSGAPPQRMHKDLGAPGGCEHRQEDGSPPCRSFCAALGSRAPPFWGPGLESATLPLALGRLLDVLHFLGGSRVACSPLGGPGLGSATLQHAFRLGRLGEITLLQQRAGKTPEASLGQPAQQPRGPACAKGRCVVPSLNFSVLASQQLESWGRADVGAET